MDRISQGDLFLEMASTVARRGTCPRCRVGALLTSDGHPVSMGYNGSAPGQPHCDEVGCLSIPGVSDGCSRTLHAEANAIAFAARFGIRTEGCTLWLTLSPCLPCAKVAAAAGLYAVVWADDYRHREGPEFLAGAGLLAGGWAGGTDAWRRAVTRPRPRVGSGA